MRLADFLRAELEPILEDWEAFAKTMFHGSHLGEIGLRDHARDMLLAIADDLDSQQSESEQDAKSKGLGPDNGKDSWAEVHGEDRQKSGFSVMETAAEFRALRASVVSHWAKTYSGITGQQFEDLTRFHEAIDQAVAESLEHYTTTKDTETRLFGAVLGASPDPIYVLDLEGRFIYANQATADLFVLEHQAIIGKTNFELGFSFAPDFQADLEKVISDQSTHRGMFLYTFASAPSERFEYLLAPVLDEHRHTEAAVCIFRDVTDRALAEEKVWHNAHHDPLTGLPNRRLFLDRLKQEVKHAKRSSLPLTLLFMDLDGFKEVNDSLGHEAGDRLLCDVTKRLTACVREEDTVARLGGDEFTIILTGAKQRKDIEVVAQTIIDAIAMPFDNANRLIQISISIGGASYPQDASTSAALLKAADQAMYQAKKSGAKRLCLYNTLDNTDGQAS